MHALRAHCMHACTAGTLRTRCVVAGAHLLGGGLQPARVARGHGEWI